MTCNCIDRHFPTLRRKKNELRQPVVHVQNPEDVGHVEPLSLEMVRRLVFNLLSAKSISININLMAGQMAAPAITS